MSMDSINGAQFFSNLSQGSSPRLESDQMSIKSEDESGSTSKVKLMCSYGGRIMMRPHDSQLRYIGGDTRIVVVSRSISYADFCVKLARICGGRSVLPKYKLPYEDFDALVSLICDDDLEAMMEEYERLDAREAPSKLRLFLFPKTSAGPAMAEPITASSLRFDSRNEQSFLDALNNTIQQAQEQQQVVSDVPDFLFGIEAAGSLSMQEVIPAADGPSSAVAQKIMEADSAMQSELPPICTTNPRKIDSTPQYDPAAIEAIEAPPKPRPLSPFLAPPATIPVQDPSIVPQIQQQQPRTIAQPLLVAQNPAAPLPATQIPSPQQQILPPRGPKKDKTSSPKKLEPKTSGKAAGEDSKLSKQSTATYPTPAPLDPVSSASVESLKLAGGDSNRDKEAEEDKTVGHVSPSNSLDTGAVKHASMNFKEMSLNVFMEQQKLEEQQQQKNLMKMQIQQDLEQQQQQQQQPELEKFARIDEKKIQPAIVIQDQHRMAAPSYQQELSLRDSQQKQQIYQQELLLKEQHKQQEMYQQELLLKEHQQKQHQQILQQSYMLHHHQPQVVYYNQQQQPYIIENNMVYFLSDQQLQAQSQPQPQAIQYIHRPVQVNQPPIQMQRGGSDPLRQQQQVPQPVVQRQLSAAAYLDQMKLQFQQQQQQQQQVPRMIFPAANRPPGATPVPVSIPLPVPIPVALQDKSRSRGSDAIGSTAAAT